MQLKTLRLANNSITSLESIQQFHSLVDLDLSNNHIGPLNITSLAKLANLQQLGLERTFISNLQHGTFQSIQQFHSLVDLDLSNNHIGPLNITSLAKLANLQQLGLERTFISNLQHGIVPCKRCCKMCWMTCGAVYDLTKNQFTIQKDVNSLRQSLFEIRLALMANRTNGSVGADNDELRRMIETANNLTLDKQELRAKTLEFKIYEQTFKVDKALELARENSDKIVVLAKRVEQWISNIVSSGGAAGLEFLGSLGQVVSIPVEK
uniref:Uncharacterized protein n=1 Tax=Anopheles melas TaxID=34690 RepID=A0A182TDC7_9DIPT